MRLLLAIMLLIPTGIFAQSEGHEWMLEELRSCYVGAQDYSSKQECIGTMTAKCQDVEEGGYSTLGMSSCNYDEYEAWDVLLNEEYQLTKASFEAWDKEEAEFSPEYARRVETLRDAQRAWIAFRDAQCELDYAIWGSGSMRQIAGTACYLDMAADRTLKLWSMRNNY